MTGVWRIKIRTKNARVRDVDRFGKARFVDEDFSEENAQMEGVEVAHVVDGLVHGQVQTGDRVVIYCDLEE